MKYLESEDKIFRNCETFVSRLKETGEYIFYRNRTIIEVQTILKIILLQIGQLTLIFYQLDHGGALGRKTKVCKRESRSIQIKNYVSNKTIIVIRNYRFVLHLY